MSALDDAVAEFEAGFSVSDEVGYRGGEQVDLARAPDGSRYVVVTSGGAGEVLGGSSAWFADEQDAAEEWLRWARTFAKERGGAKLWWRERPVWKAVEFVALNQAAVMQERAIRSAVAIKLGFVVAELSISKGEA